MSNDTVDYSKIEDGKFKNIDVRTDGQMLHDDILFIKREVQEIKRRLDAYENDEPFSPEDIRKIEALGRVLRAKQRVFDMRKRQSDPWVIGLADAIHKNLLARYNAWDLMTEDEKNLFVTEDKEQE